MIGAIGGGGSDMLQLWKEKIAAADTDKSGGLSLDEFTKLGASVGSTATSTDVSNMFSKLDSDGDGQLSTEELRPPRPHHSHPPSGSVDNAGMSLLLGLQEDSTDASASGLVSKVASALISATDTNGDGVLSASEYAAKASSDGSAAQSDRFAAADTNQDGVLSADELAKQMQDALTQQLQSGGRQAYDQLISLFKDVAQSAQTTAKTASTVDIAA